MDPIIERAIAERATTQLSLITRDQLHALGVTRSQRQRLVDIGRLVRAGSTTFRIGGVAPTFETRVLAACLDVGGVASHRSAARLHGLELPGTECAPIDIVVRKGQHRAASRIAVVHSTTDLPADDIIQIGPIPTTSVARTFLGLAAMVPELAEDDVRNAIDVASRDGKASDTWLWWLLERPRCRGRDGVTVLESILTERAGRGHTESWLEREFLAVVDAGGFELPKVQRRVRRRGSFVARVDTIWEPRTIAEVSGFATHSTRRQQTADANRRNRLITEGYRFLEFTYDHVVRQHEHIWETLTAAGIPTRSAASTFN